MSTLQPASGDDHGFGVPAKSVLSNVAAFDTPAVVAGVNEQGIELARRLGSSVYTRLLMVGFFDDRTDKRIKSNGDFPLLGKLQDLPRFANDNNIDVIYVSLPIAADVFTAAHPGAAR